MLVVRRHEVRPVVGNRQLEAATCPFETDPGQAGGVPVHVTEKLRKRQLRRSPIALGCDLTERGDKTMTRLGHVFNASRIYDPAFTRTKHSPVAIPQNENAQTLARRIVRRLS